MKFRHNVQRKSQAGLPVLQYVPSDLELGVAPHTESAKLGLFSLRIKYQFLYTLIVKVLQEYLAWTNYAAAVSDWLSSGLWQCEICIHKYLGT